MGVRVESGPPLAEHLSGDDDDDGQAGATRTGLVNLYMCGCGCLFALALNSQFISR